MAKGAIYIAEQIFQKTALSKVGLRNGVKCQRMQHLVVPFHCKTIPALSYNFIRINQHAFKFEFNMSLNVGNYKKRKLHL